MEFKKIQECTFKPKTNIISPSYIKDKRKYNKKNINNPNKNRLEEMYEHGKKAVKARKNKSKIEIEIEEQINECTFQPHLYTATKSQSNNNLNYNLNMKNILENKGNLQSLINNITNPQPEKENINNNNDLNFNFIHKSRTDNNYIPSLTNENKTNNQNKINSYQRNKVKSSLNSKREYNKNNNENQMKEDKQ